MYAFLIAGCCRPCSLSDIAKSSFRPCMCPLANPSSRVQAKVSRSCWECGMNVCRDVPKHVPGENVSDMKCDSATRASTRLSDTVDDAVEDTALFTMKDLRRPL